LHKKIHIWISRDFHVLRVAHPRGNFSARISKNCRFFTPSPGSRRNRFKNRFVKGKFFPGVLNRLKTKKRHLPRVWAFFWYMGRGVYHGQDWP